MNTADILSLFFSKSFEMQLNENILDDIEYVIDEYGLLNYIAIVLDVPYSEFLSYICYHSSTKEIQSRDITQSSSFAACESEMIDIFLSENNRGLDFITIGKHFTKYIRSKNDGAFRKYGENQVKTSAQLGLVFEYYNCWYLNCIGYIYNELHDEDRHALLARNILRDHFYSKIMNDILKHDIDLFSYMECLNSDATKLRRYDSVKRLVNICLDECKRSGIKTFSVLDNKENVRRRLKEKKMIEKKTLLICKNNDE